MKKIVQKVRVCLLSGVLLAGLTACSAGNQPQSPAAETSSETTAKTAAETAPETAAKAAAETAAEASAEKESEPVELVVFAAASMTETLEEIAGLYKETAPHVTLTYTFDSSGTLKTQIQEGSDCDIFISAAQKQMNQLDISADPSINTEGLDYVLDGSRFNLVENKVVLAVPEGNPANITSYEDLATDKLNLICVGNADVPVGAYSDEILDHLGIRGELESASKITYGSNVKEVTTQVSEGSVDCGIIYATDAFSAGLTVVDEAKADMCSQVVYPAAVMKASAHPEEAQAFLDFLQTEDCAKVFESVGFSMAE